MIELSADPIDPNSCRELARNLGFTESPVWNGNHLYVTSVNRGLIYRVNRRDATVDQIAEPGGGPSGLAAVGSDLLICQDGGQALRSRSSSSQAPGIQLLSRGRVTHLLGSPLASPSDCVMGPDDRLWITDAPGRELDREHQVTPGRVWALDLETLAIEPILVGLSFPNGIEFSADSRYLYVAESATRRVLRFAAGPNGAWQQDPWRAPRLDGVPDGLAVDVDDHVWVACSFSGAVVRLTPDGDVCARLDFGIRAVPTALCFAGADLEDLIVTSARGGAVVSIPESAHHTRGRAPFVD